MSEPAPLRPEAGFEFRLTVWPDGELGWRACIVEPDDSRRDFRSPFELARYLARPVVVLRASGGRGLR